MQPVLFIAALTALHVAVTALIDVLSSAKTWPGKLAWTGGPSEGTNHLLFDFATGGGIVGRAA